MSYKFGIVLAIAIVLLLALGSHVAADGTKVANAPNQICPILIGSTIPAITLQDLDGQSVDLNKTIADKPTVLIYFRGGW
jgi:cytochrome oxidase Cu insertion factor (SCO1/SenC/PrrC family)